MPEQMIVERGDLTREYLYSQAFEDLIKRSDHNNDADECRRFKYLFDIHQNLLNSLSLDQRAAIARRVHVEGLLSKHVTLNQILQKFKHSLTRVIRSIQNSYAFFELPPVEAAKIADLFDARLFWHASDLIISQSSEQISAAWFSASQLASSIDRPQQIR